MGLGTTYLPGLQWITHNLLRLGIALVGLRLSLDGLTSTAAVALPVVIACITVAIAVSVGIGRMLGLSRPLSLLLAAGTSVCGCTAICAMTPVVRAGGGKRSCRDLRGRSRVHWNAGVSVARTSRVR